MALVEDLAAYLRDFGVDAVLAGQPVRGIFDAGHEVADVGALGMAGLLPRLTLPTAAVPAGAVGATLTIGAAAYVVVEHRRDGTGMSELRLEAA